MKVNNETYPAPSKPSEASSPHINSQSNEKAVIDIPQSVVSSHNSSLSFYGKESKPTPT